MITTLVGHGCSLLIKFSTALFLLVALPVTFPVALRAAELPALDAQDTIVVTADQAWESDVAEVLNFEGNFQLNAPHYFVSSIAAEIHGDLDDPTLVIATGQPVKFWVEDDVSLERTYGEATRLEYDRHNHLIRLTGKAVIRDTQSVMRSEKLEYDTKARRLVGTGNGGIEIVTQPD
jgi:lipopolysaccharide transport protein LptA